MSLRYHRLANFDDNVCLYEVFGRENERLVFPEHEELLQLVGNPLEIGEHVQGDFYITFTKRFPKDTARESYELVVQGSSIIGVTGKGDCITARDGHDRGTLFRTYAEICNYFSDSPVLRQHQLPTPIKLRNVLIRLNIFQPAWAFV